MTGEFAHRLWVAALVVTAIGSLASAVAAARRERRVRRRFAALLAAQYGRRRARPRAAAEWARRWGPPAGAVIFGWVMVGGVAGWLVGLVGAYGVRRWLCTRKPDDRTGAEEAARQLPLAADLLAACIAAGAGPREAAEAVGESLGGPVGDRLSRTAAELRLGGEPAEAWGRFGEIPGAAGLARCLERAGSTGAPAAEPVSRLAEGSRAERARAAVARAQRAQVLITAPVGLCFLPAFLAVGVAPVVIGLASGLLNGN
ncbi:type II secretion system F family protein [Streptomyces scopuliridis]|uniref:Type II secretion system F family protein n=1 Tax=Streptomyces scopuliridis TaxID=452529 RepID=A0ACD4ZJL2_9ACTN|nr:type II secretion system F family protein [Streptomyces scopuliridis]WSB98672.1 type II secretion system F family protein [Streptomyces scopuliridis]WSC07625.1 type II secretion system F family protein [Streptomyces scopuliridis]